MMEGLRHSPLASSSASALSTRRDQGRWTTPLRSAARIRAADPASAAAIGALDSFDTNDVLPAERLSRWSGFLNRGGGRLVVEAIGDSQLSGTVVRSQIGELGLLHIRSSAHRTTAGALAPAVRPVVRIVFQIRGEATLVQGGTNIVLRPGNWTLCLTHRAHVITNSGDTEQCAVFIPLDLLGMSPARIQRHVGTVLGEHAGIGRMVSQFIVSLVEQADAVPSSYHADISGMVSHHIRLALDELSSGVRHERIRETMRTRVTDYIHQNVRDADLSIDRIANRFACSKRNLHKLFRDSGTTISQFIYNERLGHCRAALTDPHLRDRSITEIAFMCGFGNSTHFSRLFKASFGEPPGRWRARWDGMQG